MGRMNALWSAPAPAVSQSVAVLKTISLLRFHEGYFRLPFPRGRPEVRVSLRRPLGSTVAKMSPLLSISVAMSEVLFKERKSLGKEGPPTTPDTCIREQICLGRL